MASYCPAIFFLLPQEVLPDVPFASHDDARALMHAGSKLGRYMPSMGTNQCDFNEHVREQCERVGLKGLEFFYPGALQSARGESSYLFRGDDLARLQQRLTALMLAFGEDPEMPLGDRETVLGEMASEPSFKADLDAGQYIDYLLSARVLAQQAHDEGLGLLYVQWEER